jgi:hypothetical protein
MADKELEKLPASPHGRGAVHEEVPIAIRGYRCYIDKKIAELVKNLNEFTTKDGRKPYNTISSCQETHIVGRAGGSIRIAMEPIKKEDMINLNNIIENTFLDLSIKEKEYMTKGGKRENSGMNCDVKSRSHEYAKTLFLEIDCSVDRDIKSTFEKRRKDFTDSMNNSLKKLSGKL